MSTLRILGNRNVILVLALSLGLFWGQGVEISETLVLPALAFVMTLSTISVESSLFNNPNRWLRPALAGVLSNYFLLGGIIILLSRILPLNEAFKVGYLILAAAPPAVGVIPFTSILDGDVEFSLIGTLACYLGAFLMIPLVFNVFLDQSFDFHQSLIITLVQLILLPLIASRIVRYVNLVNRIEPFRGLLTNWSFFIVIYTVVGVNRQTIIKDPYYLLPAGVLTIVTTYFLGYGVEQIGKLTGYDPKRVTSLMLLSTSKNAGFAAGLALTLFGRETALPVTVQTILMLTYIIFLDLRRSRSNEKPRSRRYEKTSKKGDNDMEYFDDTRSMLLISAL